MNLYAAVVLATIVIRFLVELAAEILNLKALRDELPMEFEGVYGENLDTHHMTQKQGLPLISSMPSSVLMPLT